MKNLDLLKALFSVDVETQKRIYCFWSFWFPIFLEGEDEGLSGKGCIQKLKGIEINGTIWIGWWLEVCRHKWIKKLGTKTWIQIEM